MRDRKHFGTVAKNRYNHNRNENHSILFVVQKGENNNHATAKNKNVLDESNIVNHTTDRRRDRIDNTIAERIIYAHTKNTLTGNAE